MGGKHEFRPTAVGDGWLTPQLPQRQDSLEDQLMDVRRLAISAGCYDVADWIDRRHDADPQFQRWESA